jgi:hypothetical protein
MKYRFYIRNHWIYWHSDRWYLLGAGYHVQDFRLVCWQLWILGFCFCLFVESDPPKPRPFPLNWFDWKRRIKLTLPWK